jgi:formylmethanofuran dehydrogenase subunit E
MYCDICKKEVNTHIQDLTDTFNVKGIPITATIKTRICNECGAEVWDEQLEKQNEKIVYDKYNELN